MSNLSDVPCFSRMNKLWFGLDTATNRLNKHRAACLLYQTKNCWNPYNAPYSSSKDKTFTADTELTYAPYCCYRNMTINNNVTVLYSHTVEVGTIYCSGNLYLGSNAVLSKSQRGYSTSNPGYTWDEQQLGNTFTYPLSRSTADYRLTNDGNNEVDGPTCYNNTGSWRGNNGLTSSNYSSGSGGTGGLRVSAAYPMMMYSGSSYWGRHCGGGSGGGAFSGRGDAGTLPTTMHGGPTIGGSAKCRCPSPICGGSKTAGGGAGPNYKTPGVYCHQNGWKNDCLFTMIAAGGGGGALLIKVRGNVYIGSGASIKCNGGAGQSITVQSGICHYAAGGGAGGGIVVLLYGGTLTSYGSVTASGGAGGTEPYGLANGGNGGAGTVRIVKVHQDYIRGV
jgi:hypothetical protein